MVTLNNQWQKVYTVEFTGALSTAHPNPAAHGGTCDIEMRRDCSGRLQARLVNRNGDHLETGNPFSPPAIKTKFGGTVAIS